MYVLTESVITKFYEVLTYDMSCDYVCESGSWLVLHHCEHVIFNFFCILCQGICVKFLCSSGMLWNKSMELFLYYILYLMCTAVVNVGWSAACLRFWSLRNLIRMIRKCWTGSVTFHAYSVWNVGHLKCRHWQIQKPERRMGHAYNWGLASTRIKGHSPWLRD